MTLDSPFGLTVTVSETYEKDNESTSLGQDGPGERIERTWETAIHG